MSNTEQIEDERFDECYINRTHDFYGKEFENGEFAIHARKKINGELYWLELDCNDDSITDYYLNVLESEFNQIQKRENA